MPAEWEQHSATQLQWPSNLKLWPGEILKKLEEMYCKIIEELHFFEVIHLFVEDLSVRNRVMNKLSLKAVDLDRIVIHQKKINDIWARDCGPIFAKNEQGDQVIIDWGFNAWGKKYMPWSDDDSIPSFVAHKYNKKCLYPGMILEGGSIEVNGKGDILTTESVLLNENRNPDRSKNDVEKKLREYLGAEQVIWLKEGLSDDGRDGQIQNVTRWLNKDTVLTVVTTDESHPDHDTLQENLETLKTVILTNDKPLNVEILELPECSSDNADSSYMKNKGLSYSGFYIANGAVLVPQFSQSRDTEVRGLLKRYFPGRKIIPIDCTSIAYRAGNIHSITQQWQGITY